MKLIKGLALMGTALALSACAIDAPKKDKTVDNGFDSKHLSTLQAGIWVDSEGCDHWIIDDGVEGYLSARLDKYGKPICSGIASANTAVGDFKGGSVFPDPI